MLIIGCRISGVKSLRVVDASIFPKISNTNPIAGIWMAAEKCVDEIMKGR